MEDPAGTSLAEVQNLGFYRFWRGPNCHPQDSAIPIHPITCKTQFYARFHYATFHFYVMPDSFSMLCQIPLCMIPLCLSPVYCYARFQIQISTLCLIPLCHFLLYHFPLFCYDWFRYDRFRYAHFSFLKLYLIPLCHITLCPSALWQVPHPPKGPVRKKDNLSNCGVTY